MRIATLVLGTVLVLVSGHGGWAEEAAPAPAAPAEAVSPAGMATPEPSVSPPEDPGDPTPGAIAESPAPAGPEAASEVAAAPAAALEAPESPGPEASDADAPAAGGEPATTDPATQTDSEGAPAAPPTAAAEPASGHDPEAAPAEAAAESRVALGPVGYDAQGRPGRIHIVKRGDTLWDISDAYLGTPWVWPSIWEDNPDVANPHLIYPGDRIWITPTEMRRVTEEEAEQLLAGAPAPAEPEVPPAAIQEVPIQEAPARRTLRVSSMEAVGLVSSEEIDAAASIVDSPKPVMWFSQESEVYVGLGQGEVEVGDQFSVVRAIRPVKDLETGQKIGVYVEKLGWIEISEVHAESSLAVVRSSVAEMRRGDRILPRQVPKEQIALLPTPPGIQGRIIYTPESRTAMAARDLVFLNRGTDDGLEVGHQLEVYRPGRLAMDTARGQRVQLPDDLVGDLVVISTQPETAVAVVMHAKTELSRGDRFRAGAPTAGE